MKKLTLITIIAMFATLAITIAQPMHGRAFHGKQGLMGKLSGFNFYENNVDELKLNDAQVKQLKEIDDAFQKERIDLRAKIMHAGLDLKNEMRKTSINKDEALNKQDVVLKMKNDMQKRAMSYKIDLNNVLNDEQKSKIDDIRKNCRKEGIGNNRSGKGQCDGSGKGMGSGGKGQGCGFRNF
ncbi:Spy/CpxP family protein refolding chaperone [Bacteroidota bacterium]